eukprot:NODE_42_length_29671_cov_0.584810.p11 type:complete len:185 gc:universal NODE_42_length_29671_cov_0.584810:24947-25501(+)
MLVIYKDQKDVDDLKGQFNSKIENLQVDKSIKELLKENLLFVHKPGQKNNNSVIWFDNYHYMKNIDMHEIKGISNRMKTLIDKTGDGIKFFLNALRSFLAACDEDIENYYDHDSLVYILVCSLKDRFLYIECKVDDLMGFLCPQRLEWIRKDDGTLNSFVANTQKKLSKNNVAVVVDELRLVRQ